jgi:hypothetical protein
MSRRRVLVYVAGPFRAKTPYDVELNCDRARAVAVAVARTVRGFPCCPHTMGRGLSGACPDQVWLDGDLDMMEVCDAVVVLPNFEKSSGTLGEVAVASTERIPTFFLSKVSDDPEDLFSCEGGEVLRELLGGSAPWS